MWLIICEKPSVAQDIAKALKFSEKADNHFIADPYLITWASGHLLELATPEDIDPKYKSWLLKDLPILPETFQYKPKPKQESHLKSIKKLAQRKEIEGIINGCDAGREGELIFREIYNFCDVSKPIKRLWLQSLTTASILKEIKEPKDGKLYNPLYDAARCRSESDWLIGMNGTRALTKRLKSRKSAAQSAWSVGRVQTPTLSLLVKKEIDILKHRSRPYWTLSAEFDTEDHSFRGDWWDPSFKKSEDEELKDNRLFDYEKLQAIIKSLPLKGVAHSTETTKDSTENSPPLFDLTSLQRAANSKFSMSAQRTLQSAQRLYEQHKMTTYPRTDSKYLPEDYRPFVQDVLDNISQSSLDTKTHAKNIKKDGIYKEERIFNTSKVSDHFAIIPTGQIKELEGDDARIFDMILRRFLSALMPPAQWLKFERTTILNGQHFITKAQSLKVKGWRAVNGVEEDTIIIPPLKEPSVTLSELHPLEEKTNPPGRISEARLLSLMENCGKDLDDESMAEALKEKGIGTPATRAETIENLISKEYLYRIGKNLRPSLKAMRLMDIMQRIPVDILSDVKLTGELEFDLKNIEKGLYSRKEFMSKMARLTEEITEKVKTFSYEDLYDKEPPLGTCPECHKGSLKETFWAYQCNNEDCKYLVWKEKSQKFIDRALMKDLLAQKVVGPLEFYSAGGHPYETYASLNTKGLVFTDENGTITETIDDGSILHEEIVPETCFLTSGRLYETASAYFCEFKVTETTTGKKPKEKTILSRMPKVLCSRPISREEYLSFIQKGETPTITDFQSKKGRPFVAILKMKVNGSFEFRFQAREKKPVDKEKKPRVTKAKKVTLKKPKKTA